MIQLEILADCLSYKLRSSSIRRVGEGTEVNYFAYTEVRGDGGQE